MQERIRTFNKEQGQSLAVGMGLHMGPLIMGIIGDEHRNDPATIADTVNAASRMESLTKHYGANIIVTENSINSLENKANFHFRYLGKIQVKGKKQAIKAFECFDGDSPSVKNLKLNDLKSFEEGMDNFYAREFASAVAIFDNILKNNPQDLVASYFRTRSAEYTISGVLEDWDGVERMENK
jgi:hypothetical protein